MPKKLRVCYFFCYNFYFTPENKFIQLSPASKLFKTSQSINPHIFFDFEEKTWSRESGALADTAKRILGETIYADDRGVVNLEATDKFGDFDAVALTKKVNITYLAKKSTITSTMVDHENNQYRLFFSDGTAIYFSMMAKDRDGKSLKGATFVELGKVVRHSAVGEDAAGNFIRVFTSDYPYVFKMDSGTSFDGLDIHCELQTAHHSYGYNDEWKRFFSATFEMDCAAPMYKFNFTTDMDYHEDLTRGITTPGSFKMNVHSDKWSYGSWSTFIWTQVATVNRLKKRFSGRGTNMSILLSSRNRYAQQHIIHNVTIHYKLEGERR